jgi:hypothetical protein
VVHDAGWRDETRQDILSVSGLHMLFGEAPTKPRNTAKPDGMNRRRAAMSRCGLAITLSDVLACHVVPDELS